MFSMKYTIAGTLLCLIAVSQCHHTVSNNTQTPDFIRGKRQNAPRVWRNNHSNNRLRSSPAQPRTSTVAPAQVTPHPCDPYVPPKSPDFTGGRRISEAKCLEYVWKMKIRQEIVVHDQKCAAERNKIWGRHFVLGGRDAEPGEFPHMGALGWRAVEGTWIFKCGSSLISSKFVVTAAHCSRIPKADTTISNPTPQIVRLGEVIVSATDASYGVKAPDRVDAKIIRIIVHPQYAPPKSYYDIALMELAEQVTFTKYVQPACVWGQFHTSALGSQATVAGWGYTNSARTISTPNLQVAVVDIIDQKQCNSLLLSARIRLFSGLQDHQICAGQLAGGVDTCQGDSGGPLQVKISLPITTQGSLHRLIGITSFGKGCGAPNLPGVYTRVASFIDWIEKTVWGGKNKDT